MRIEGHRLAAVLFDLDGTLLDTAADIARALNRTLLDEGWPSLAEEAVRSMVGRGAPQLIVRASRALGMSPSDAQRESLVTRFLHHYTRLEERDETTTRPYPGAVATLEQVRLRGLPTAVVTNKQQAIAESLLERLGLAAHIDVVVGGDRCRQRKPHPEPLLFACRALDASPERALMVGDSINDVEAARGAGMPVACVTYGYNEGVDPRTLPADVLIDSLLELLPLLRPAP